MTVIICSEIAKQISGMLKLRDYVFKITQVSTQQICTHLLTVLPLL